MIFELPTAAILGTVIAYCNPYGSLEQCRRDIQQRQQQQQLWQLQDKQRRLENDIRRHQPYQYHRGY